MFLFGQNTGATALSEHILTVIRAAVCSLVTGKNWGVGRAGAGVRQADLADADHVGSPAAALGKAMSGQYSAAVWVTLENKAL